MANIRILLLATLLLTSTAIAQGVDNPAASDNSPSPTDSATGANLLAKAESTLMEVVRRIDAHLGLPASKWIGDDQEKNREAMDRLLNQAVDLLGVTEGYEVRQRILTGQSRVQDLRNQIVQWRQDARSAPTADSLNRVQRLWTTTKEDYEGRIHAAEKEIHETETEIEESKRAFVHNLYRSGIDISSADAAALLSVDPGEQFYVMCGVIHNVRQIVEELRRLTEESGEDLAYAKRYYGMYLVLCKAIDHAQGRFVRDINNRQIPALESYVAEARRIIYDAEKLLAEGNPHPDALRANIEANRLTIRACNELIGYLMTHAAGVEEANRIIRGTVLAATNTYDTVKISSEVLAALRSSGQDFDKLLAIQDPGAIREFENEMIRTELVQLVARLRGTEQQ